MWHRGELELVQKHNQAVCERMHQRGGGFETLQNQNYADTRRRRMSDNNKNGTMIIVHSELSDAHHAIYRDLNQKIATRLRIGAYVFDMRGCKYPYRTI